MCICWICIGYVQRKIDIGWICIRRSDVHLLNMHQVVKRGTEDKAIDYVFKLLDIPWWYYAIAVLLGAAAWRLWKRPSLGMLIGYAFLILAETVLIRKPFQGEHIKLELFWSWRAWSVQQNQILANVIMFVPVGVLIGWIWRWRGLWFAAGLSVGIEILQLVTSRGLCEFDDVFHNLIGAVIGIGVVMVLKRMKVRCNKWCYRGHNCVGL